MNFGKSMLPWIMMAAIMLLMLSQGFTGNNMMFIMMIAGMMALIMFWMKNRKRSLKTSQGYLLSKNAESSNE
jgi:membrane protein implicated in regulation of membrane protease activity